MASQNLINIIIQAQDKASQTAEKVESKLRGLGTVSNALGKIPGFDLLKTKLTGVSNTLRTKFGGAIDGVRSKLTSLSNGTSGLVSSMNFLKGAVSMTAGLIGFELVTGLVQAGREALNAASKLDYFSQRLGMSSSESTKFKQEISDLQREFRKVDMTAVGATAEEIAVKMDLPKDKLTDLTRMTAVMSSTFVKEGRTQEDAVLAVGDALDGQFRRLQEIGITQDKLIQNGWSGDLEDQAGLIDALNKTMQDMGYEQTAKDITNLDEAFTALSVAGGQLLQQVLVPITPALIGIIEALISATDVIGPFITGLTNLAGSLPDWLKDGAIFAAFGAAVIAVGMWINATLIPAFAAATLAALEFAAAMLANPLTWVVIALAAVAYAIYEVGKAFGWWTDIQSMLDAVWSGIQRLWNAFINHPDVQAIISTITWAWNGLSGAIGGVIQWIGSFFNASSSGNFDIVRSLINGIGLAWQAITLPMRTVINVLQFVKNGFNVNLNDILKLIITIGTQWVNNAKAKAKAFVTGIVNFVKLLPGKIASYLSNTLSRIKSGIQSWITSAKSKVSTLISNITSPFSGVASKISSNLSGVASALLKPFTDAWAWIKPYYDKIKDALAIVPGMAAGGETADGRTSLLINDTNTIATTTSTGTVSENNSVELEHNLNITLDLANVPSTMSTNDLITALTSTTVLKALTNNNNFQLLDGKAKERLNLKLNRARGV